MHLYVARIITEEETMSSQDTVKKLGARDETACNS